MTGEQTAGRYSLIDMLVPPGGGPPPHRHDFEEMFTILAGEIEPGAPRQFWIFDPSSLFALRRNRGGEGGKLHGVSEIG